MSYGSSGRSILRIAFFQPWPEDQLAVKHRNMKETLAVRQFEVCSYPPSREWEWENKVRTVSESHSLALWHHRLLMFVFLLVVMVPKMKPKTVCAGRLVSNWSKCLDRIPWTWRLHGHLVKRLQGCPQSKRVPCGLSMAAGRWGRSGTQISWWKLNFIFQGWKHLHGQHPGRRDKNGPLKKTWHSRGNQVETMKVWKGFPVSPVSPVSTGVPGKWFGGHWWLLQSGGFSRGVWNLNAASRMFFHGKNAGEKKPEKPEVAICPRGQWNESRDLFLFGSDLALHDFWQRFFFFSLLLFISRHLVFGPCGLDIWVLSLQMVVPLGPIIWDLRRWLGVYLFLDMFWNNWSIYILHNIFIYVFIRIYTSMSSLHMYTSLGCYFGHLLHLSPGHMRIR